jgi:hypothetical protein
MTRGVALGWHRGRAFGPQDARARLVHGAVPSTMALSSSQFRPLSEISQKLRMF